MSRKKLEKMLTATFAVDYKVRIVLIGGEPHFVAVDVAKILDIKNVRQNLADFPENEKKLIDLNGITNRVYNTYAISGAVSGGWIENKVWVVNEPGLYRLIFSSRKEEAEKFKCWVFHEVLPSIRKTGSYSVKKKQSRDFQLSPEIKRFRIIEPIELDLSKDTKKVRKFKLEHPKYQDCTDWIEYDKITEIPIDEEFRNFYNEGGDPEDWIREMKKFGRVKFLEVGV